ncbi:MAG TPA: site-2 protease family protein [Sedimentisphaerales bacterium]|nr:site-2 protease family protein [Sedimentisphaerales bacterium]
MSKETIFSGKYFRMFLMAIIVVPVILLIARNIGFVGNALLVLLGFGAVVIVHEFGHFVVAKASGIKVEAFSLFMPPMLLGVQKTEEGIRVRILPEILPKKDDDSGNGALCFTFAGKYKPSETEYRVGLIPFGGFVKMLGQEDTGSVKSSDDPRSYANKPPHTRAAVLAAGVTFNVISAVIVFMIVFLVGINLTPAIVGDVMPGSPAQRAGLKAGDEIIEIAGESEDLDFGNIAIAAALSGRNEKVQMRVRHLDGTEEDFALVAEQLPEESLRGFGIIVPESLTIGKLSKDDADDLFAKTGLLPGDLIKSVNGRHVTTYWEMAQIVKESFLPAIKLSAERIDPVSKEVRLIETKISMRLSAPIRPGMSESALSGNIYTLVPRMRITDVLASKDSDNTKPSLQPDDIILAVGNVDNPTYKQMRDITIEYEGKELPIKVLRTGNDGVEQIVTVTVVPRLPKGGNEVMIGVGVAFDLEHAVVAGTIALEDGSAALEIPAGAAITAVDGVPVSNFYDVAMEIGKYIGQHITINYRLNEEVAGAVSMDVAGGEDLFAVKTTFAEPIPLKLLEKTYKADGPVDAVVMGYRKTVMFVAQTYVTLRRLIGGLVSPKDLMGPVGIMTLSYRIVAERPFVYYVYFLGLISAAIAVFNFLPLPPLDGGLVVLLLAEKIKGSALSERVQAIIAYAGWTLIGSLILYVTFNDIVKNFFS